MTHAKISATVRVDQLPRELIAQFPAAPPPGSRVRVTIEPAVESDAEKLAALRADIQAGLDDLEAGRTVDLETVRQRMRDGISVVRIPHGSRDIGAAFGSGDAD